MIISLLSSSSASPSISYKTHTHTHIDVQTHTHTLTHRHTHTHTDTDTHTHKHAQRCSNTHRYTTHRLFFTTFPRGLSVHSFPIRSDLISASQLCSNAPAARTDSS